MTRKHFALATSALLSAIFLYLLADEALHNRFAGASDSTLTALTALSTAAWSWAMFHCVASNGIFSYSSVYLMTLGLFHLGLIVPHYLLGIDECIFVAWLDSPQLARAILLCGLAFSAYSFGNLFATSAVRTENRPAPPRAHSHLLYFGLGIYLFGLTLLMYASLKLGLFSGSYAASYTERLASDPRLFGSSMMLTFMGMIIAAAGANKKQITLVALATVGGFSPLFLFGFRGPLLVHGLALLCIWYRKEPKRALQFGLAGAVLVLLLVPVVRELREGKSESRSSLAHKPVEFFQESGGSIYPLVATLEQVLERNEPYWLGRSYAIAAASIPPNLSSTWSAPRDIELPPNHWITSRVNPWIFERGGGLGYSGVAEPYLNFGIPGVIAFFFILGFLLRKCETWAARNCFMLAAISYAFAALLWTVRNDFTNFARPAVWGAAVVLGLAVLLGQPRTAAAEPKLSMRGV